MDTTTAFKFKYLQRNGYPPQLAYGNLKPAPVSKIGKCSLKFPKYNKYPVPKKLKKPGEHSSNAIINFY
jgi:hypothetical protein